MNYLSKNEKKTLFAGVGSIELFIFIEFNPLSTLEIVGEWWLLPSKVSCCSPKTIPFNLNCALPSNHHTGIEMESNSNSPIKPIRFKPAHNPTCQTVDFDVCNRFRINSAQFQWRVFATADNPSVTLGRAGEFLCVFFPFAMTPRPKWTKDKC